MLQHIYDSLAPYVYTPDGGLADPLHPIYMLMWLLKVLS